MSRMRVPGIGRADVPMESTRMPYQDVEDQFLRMMMGGGTEPVTPAMLNLYRMVFHLAAENEALKSILFQRFVVTSAEFDRALKEELKRNEQKAAAFLLQMGHGDPIPPPPPPADPRKGAV